MTVTTQTAAVTDGIRFAFEQALMGALTHAVGHTALG